MGFQISESRKKKMKILETCKLDNLVFSEKESKKKGFSQYGKSRISEEKKSRILRGKNLESRDLGTEKMNLGIPSLPTYTQSKNSCLSSNKSFHK